MKRYFFRFLGLILFSILVLGCGSSTNTTPTTSENSSNNPSTPVSISGTATDD